MRPEGPSSFASGPKAGLMGVLETPVATPACHASKDSEQWLGVRGLNRLLHLSGPQSPQLKNSIPVLFLRPTYA